MTILVMLGYLGGQENPILLSGGGAEPAARWWLDLHPAGPILGTWFAARALLHDQRLWALRSERRARMGALLQLSLGAFAGALAIGLGLGLSGPSPLIPENLPTIGLASFRTGILGALLIKLIRRPLVLPILLWWLPQVASALGPAEWGSIPTQLLSAWLGWPSGPLPLQTILGSGVGFGALAGWWILKVQGPPPAALPNEPGD